MGIVVQMPRRFGDEAKQTDKRKSRPTESIWTLDDAMTERVQVGYLIYPLVHTLMSRT